MWRPLDAQCTWDERLTMGSTNASKTCKPFAVWIHALLHVCCGCYPSDCRIYITRRHGMVGEISMNDAAVRWTCASHTFCITAGLVRLCFFDMHFVCCLLLLFYVSAIKLQKDIRLSLDLFYEQTLSVYVAPLYTSMVDIVRLILSSG